MEAAKEFEVEIADEKDIEYIERFGMILLQLALIVRKHAELGDSAAVEFFEDAFTNTISAARDILRSKMN